MKRLTDKAVIEEARTYLGTKWRHAQRRRGVAVDCVGLLTGVADAFGYPYKDSTTYNLMPDGRLVPALVKFLDQMSTDSAAPGRVGVFWLDKVSRLPQHVGIFTDYRGFGLIHTYMDVGKVVEHQMSEFWRDRLTHVFAFRGIEELI